MSYSPAVYSAKNFGNNIFNNDPLSRFVVSLSGCPHIAADKAALVSRNSATEFLTEIRSINPYFAIILGDFFNQQRAVELSNSADVTDAINAAFQLSQGFGNLANRNFIYTMLGNHDWGVSNSGLHDTYIDNMGVNTATSGVTNSLRPFPIRGTNDAYAFETGNITWICLSDRNDQCDPCGFTVGSVAGAYPSGAVLQAAYNFFVLEANAAAAANRNIIVCSHHALKNTTYGSGDNEGVNGLYHGSTSGRSISTGNLYDIITSSTTSISDQNLFQTYLSTYPGRISAWFIAHTHGDPDESYVGRGTTYNLSGTFFRNVSALCRYHNTVLKQPRSDAITFTKGSTNLKIQNVNHGGFRSSGLDPNFIYNVTLNYPWSGL